MAITIANTGRSIKKRAMASDPRLPIRLKWFRCYRHSRPDSQLAFYHDLVSRLQALLHNPVIAYTLAGGYRAGFHLITGADGINSLHTLYLLHGALRHQDRAFSLIRPEANAPELA